MVTKNENTHTHTLLLCFFSSIGVLFFFSFAVHDCNANVYGARMGWSWLRPCVDYLLVCTCDAMCMRAFDGMAPHCYTMHMCMCECVCLCSSMVKLQYMWRWRYVMEWERMSAMQLPKWMVSTEWGRWLCDRNGFRVSIYQLTIFCF